MKSTPPAPEPDPPIAPATSRIGIARIRRKNVREAAELPVRIGATENWTG